MEQNSKPEEYGIRIDLSTGEIDLFLIAAKPEIHQFGMYTSHRTGSIEQMEMLKQSIIEKSLRILKKVK